MFSLGITEDGTDYLAVDHGIKKDDSLRFDPLAHSVNIDDKKYPQPGVAVGEIFLYLVGSHHSQSLSTSLTDLMGDALKPTHPSRSPFY